MSKWGLLMLIYVNLLVLAAANVTKYSRVDQVKFVEDSL